MISCNYWLFTEVKYDNGRTVSKRKHYKETAEQNVARVPAIGFLARFSSLLLLVLLLSEDSSTINLGRSGPDMETAQTPDRMQVKANPQFT